MYTRLSDIHLILNNLIVNCNVIFLSSSSINCAHIFGMSNESPLFISFSGYVQSHYFRISILKKMHLKFGILP